MKINKLKSTIIIIIIKKSKYMKGIILPVKSKTIKNHQKKQNNNNNKISIKIYFQKINKKRVKRKVEMMILKKNKYAVN